MFRRIITLSLSLMVIAAAARSVQAQVEGSGRLMGRAYFDLSKGLSDDNKEVLTYRFRRVYFTYDMKISDNVSGRFQTDVEQNTAGYYRVFLKNAYAEWKAKDNLSLRFGQQGTILFGDIEQYWGYRSVAKTMQDHFGVRSAADIGISGRFKISDIVSLRVMMSNGDGFSKKDDEGIGTFNKAYEVQGVITPAGGLLISLHLGMNGFDVDGDPATDDSENSTTMDISAGYEGDGFAIGGSFTSQTNHQFNDGEDGSGFWAFGRYSLPNSSLTLLGRYDNWDPDTGAGDNTETYMIIGLDYEVAEGLSIIPNIQQMKSGNADAVNVVNLTFYWRW